MWVVLKKQCCNEQKEWRRQKETKCESNKNQTERREWDEDKQKVYTVEKTINEICEYIKEDINNVDKEIKRKRDT